MQRSTRLPRSTTPITLAVMGVGGFLVVAAALAAHYPIVLRALAATVGLITAVVAGGRHINAATPAAAPVLRRCDRCGRPTPASDRHRIATDYPGDAFPLGVELVCPACAASTPPAAPASVVDPLEALLPTAPAPRPTPRPDVDPATGELVGDRVAALERQVVELRQALTEQGNLTAAALGRLTTHQDA